MWIITYNKKPVTAMQVHTIENRSHRYLPDNENMYFAGAVRQEVIDLFLYNFGYSWVEWANSGYGIERFYSRGSAVRMKIAQPKRRKTKGSGTSSRATAQGKKGTK